MANSQSASPRNAAEVVRLTANGAQWRGESRSLYGDALRRLGQDKLTLFAIGVLLIIAVAAFFAPFLTANVLGVDPEATNPDVRLLPPGTPGHFLGTDDLGRDYLARLLYGGRISLTIGFLGASITIGIGIVLGMFTGYFGGVVDDVMNWVITTLDSIPTLYLLILISTVMRPSAEALILALALTGWTGGARLIRGQTLALRNQEYILSALAVGASPLRIMFRHILPNLLSVTLISLASGIGGLIIAESTLSFLKLGVMPPTPTWGNMLTNAQQHFSRGPHLAIVSGMLIFITVLCLYLIGDGLRDAFDPQLKK